MHVSSNSIDQGRQPVRHILDMQGSIYGSDDERSILLAWKPRTREVRLRETFIILSRPTHL